MWNCGILCRSQILEHTLDISLKCWIATPTSSYILHIFYVFLTDLQRITDNNRKVWANIKKRNVINFNPEHIFFHPETSSHQSTIGRHRFTNSSRSVRPVVPSSMHGSCTNGGGRWGSSDAKWNMGNLWLNSWGILRCQCLISNWFGWCLSSSIRFLIPKKYQEVPTR